MVATIVLFFFLFCLLCSSIFSPIFPPDEANAGGLYRSKWTDSLPHSILLYSK